MHTKLIASLGESRTQQLAARDAADEGMRTITETVATEKRDALSEPEQTAFEAHRAARAKARTEIEAIDARMAELVAEDEADIRSAETLRKAGINLATVAPVGGATVTDPEVYRKGGQRGYSYFRDLALANNGNAGSIDRLRRNDKAVKEQRAGVTTVNGVGGEFVPPLWLEDEWIAYLRPGRVIVNHTTNAALPGGTDSINIPKVLTGTATAQQTTQNTLVNETDLTTTSISSSVVTIAGGQTISMQLMEQSPINIDALVLKDLAADYVTKFEAMVIAALVAAGTSVAYTQASPTFIGAGQFYSTILKAISALETARYAPPTAIFMHPRRWNWCLNAADTTGRNLIVPNASGPFNASGVAQDPAAQGYVGILAGLPVFVDANIPVNLGTGTNQDEVFVAKADDVLLWEGDVRAEAFQQTYAQNLSLYVRLYNYASVQAAKYAQSIQVIGGTGLVPPTF